MAFPPSSSAPHYMSIIESVSQNRQNRRRNSTTSTTSTTNMIKGPSFYGEYHGHKVDHLEILLPALRETSDSLIWTAGDSSLDNKYWFSDHRPAVGAYRQVLEPPATMNADVNYWLNYLAEEKRAQVQTQTATTTTRTPVVAAINTAVEATTVNERTHRLRPQDIFLRDNIRTEDTLVVSIGGNDVAMKPMPCTICSVLSVVNMPLWCLEQSSCVCASPPCDEHFSGCGPVATASCACAFPPCIGYTTHLFGTRIQRYIEKLTAKTSPKRILVCMIYYPEENPSPSWAGTALRSLGYDKNPERLQWFIRRMFVEATSKIRIHNSKDVVPVPLFEVLDGKTREDYVARVEPSPEGGRKMAEYILRIIEQHERNPYHACAYNNPSSTTTPATSSLPVESSYMVDRS